MNAMLDQPQGSTTDGFLVKLNSRGLSVGSGVNFLFITLKSRQSPTSLV